MLTDFSKSNPKDMGFALNVFQSRGRVNLTRIKLKFGQWETKVKFLIAYKFSSRKIIVT